MIVLHHLASSGGTVFSKALATQGNCRLVNEVHPYFSIIPDAAFSPTTAMDQFLARYKDILSEDQVSESRQELFQFQLRYLCGLVEKNNHLLVREWSHGDFFASERFSSSTLPLLDFAKPTSLITLRHPVDCFLSGKTYNAWNPIKSDINEFCRRYVKFLDYFLERPGSLVVKYEDFAANPDAILKDLCEQLGLAFRPDYLRDLNKYRLSGASGRTSYDRIAPRPRRPVSVTEREAFLRSAHYIAVCERVGYQADL